jgi:hypothetical protein
MRVPRQAFAIVCQSAFAPLATPEGLIHCVDRFMSQLHQLREAGYFVVRVSKGVPVGLPGR